MCENTNRSHIFYKQDGLHVMIHDQTIQETAYHVTKMLINNMKTAVERF